MPGDRPSIAVVTVAYNSADALPQTLGALSDQLLPGDEVVVVDNGSADGSATVARSVLPSALVLEGGGNIGFAAGCNRGVAASSADLVLLLNPDCTPAPGFLDALRARAVASPSWGAWQALVTLEDEAVVNTAGNVMHFLGIGWAGQLDEPVSAVGGAHEVGFASGAAMVVRREAWEAAQGFDEAYFMYGEDLDLSLRLRLAGLAIGVEPAARVAHDYTFTKGDYKWFYLERNRAWTVLSVYPARLLGVLAPALLAFELVLLVAAARGGWLRPKLRAQRAVVRELPQILARRRRVQATAAISAAEFARPLVASLDSPVLAGAAAIPGVPLVLSAYWRLASSLL